MKAAEFLDLIEHWGVMPPMQVKNLRKQIGSAEYPVHPVLLARRLVEEGYINSYFAKTLLAGGPPTETPNMASETSGNEPTDVRWRELDEEEELRLEDQLSGLELPPIEGADWLTRSADGDTISALPTLATTTALGPTEPESAFARWYSDTPLSGVPWWLAALAAVGVITLLVTILVLIF